MPITSPMEKSPIFYDQVGRDQSYLMKPQQVEKEIDFPFNEEQIFKDSFPNSPFCLSSQTNIFDKKLSQLFKGFQSPKKSLIEGNNSLISEQTPINPLNKYLMIKEQDVSPMRFGKFEESCLLYTSDAADE